MNPKKDKNTNLCLPWVLLVLFLFCVVLPVTFYICTGEPVDLSADPLEPLKGGVEECAEYKNITVIEYVDDVTYLMVWRSLEFQCLRDCAVCKTDYGFNKRCGLYDEESERCYTACVSKIKIRDSITVNRTICIK